MKLVHWPLMGELLHLVQQGEAWAGCGHAQSPCCTKCNSLPINSQYTNFISLNVALLVPLCCKELNKYVVGVECIYLVHIKKCHWCFHNNFYKYAQIFMIFGTQLCKWIYFVACHVNGDVMLMSLKSCRSPCTWHCHHAAERDAKSLSLQRCGHPIWIRWTVQHLGILQVGFELPVILPVIYGKLR